ncbi:spore coat polysaccharide biosynthesis protein; SpsA [Synechocystis sp. PCC 6803]|uniref:Spore coat polysaccharide biosynthesis protein SpsA n=1 Tax=Synechocystis sp. (strain ATCC 27184 / PCC 6803 / Kazusa) TaxID=1111708 RepID=P73983_SYNY3|nr:MULTISPECIES: glycosyltransferase family 2 protein [unclassified Synechocystis]BAM51799.1 spore coat polysaccharide biosynthesis proteinSpsA [Synechocystis sp. PCC 6803] [Bacillus subtilis BEST7613]AGF51741.1 spore coat polysaccharide biosynthesis protein SpsA [Synechocystis sp. PCC 6803]ALJ67730.1 spore coat protein [Synechocystis sp. PCC 6803]AVP89561.1 glycosyltransferase family 2 protein [Synechocystis sp. IPPAS B-1465]MBD2618687.1 glycosyltransferase family 2 protein [Synechocystis sp.
MNEEKQQELLISVIITNYNYDQFIDQAIESVLSQTYYNFELIIVDDGSTDNSRDVISSYTDSRIKALVKNNGGQASAFNAGFEQANGEIICFLDSDDWWKPEKLETIIRWHYFINKDYAIFQHVLDVWYEGKTRPYKHILPSGDCFAEMKKVKKLDFFVPTSGLSFPKKILDRIFPIPIKFIIAADSYIMRTACVFNMVYSIPKSLGFYRQHDNTVFLNPDFDLQPFLKEILIPELNQFYQKYRINYQIEISDYNFNERKKNKKQKIFEYLKKVFF